MNKKVFIIFLTILFFGIFNYVGASTFKLQEEQNCLLEKAKEELGMRITVVSRVRSYKEQDALWAQGRCENNKNKDIVTNEKAGYSYHNFGYAFDIKDSYIKRARSEKISENQWIKLRDLAQECGLTSVNGNNFHFQISVSGVNLEELRNKDESYKTYIDLRGSDPCVMSGSFDVTTELTNKQKEAMNKALKEICAEDRNYGIIGFDGGICDNSKSAPEVFTSTVQGFINWAVGIAFLLAVLAIFWAGFILLFANGQPAKRTQAINILKNVIIGLFVIASAWLIIDWVFELFKVDDSYKFIKNNK